MKDTQTAKPKKRRRGLIVFLKVVACFAIIIAILLLGVKMGEKLAFASFYNNAQRGLRIPGTNSGFVGQGLDYVEEENAFLTCGYSAKKGECSMVYVMKENGDTVKTALKNSDGSNYLGHTGGIAHFKDYCYITGDDGCDVFSLEDILLGGEAKKIGEIASPHDPAYVVIHENKLYEGSFYRSGNYETPQSERITTPCGDENKSLIYVYDLDETLPFGVNQTPVAAYSATGLVQGMTFAEDKIVLSTSYGFSASHLIFYDLSKAQTENKAVGTYELDVTYLDSSCRVREVKAPPMSEEIVYKDGAIFIMTESASNKYIFGKFMSGRYMYSYSFS